MSLSHAGQMRLTSDDVLGRFIPGNYFEYKAQFYLKKKDYAVALQMAQLAGYWANKSAQYNVGIMYFTGTGTAVDKARGAAWLRIAAEHQDATALKALAAASAELSPEQRDNADRIWQTLAPVYGDAVTLPRAQRQFDDEKKNVTGSHLGFMSAIKVVYGGPDGDHFDSADHYYAEQQHEFDTYLEANFGHGHVDVGPIQPDQPVVPATNP